MLVQLCPNKATTPLLCLDLMKEKYTNISTDESVASYLWSAHSRGPGSRTDRLTEDKASCWRQGERRHWVPELHVAVLYFCSSPHSLRAGLSKPGNSPWHFPSKISGHRNQDAGIRDTIPQVVSKKTPWRTQWLMTFLSSAVHCSWLH